MIYCNLFAVVEKWKNICFESLEFYVCFSDYPGNLASNKFLSAIIFKTNETLKYLIDAFDLEK